MDRLERRDQMPISGQFTMNNSTSQLRKKMNRLIFKKKQMNETREWTEKRLVVIMCCKIHTVTHLLKKKRHGVRQLL